MKRITLMWIVLTGALLIPTAGFAQISCSREGLQKAVDLYIAAQTKGDTSGLPLAMGMTPAEPPVGAVITRCPRPFSSEAARANAESDAMPFSD